MGNYLWVERAVAAGLCLFPVDNGNSQVRNLKFQI